MADANPQLEELSTDEVRPLVDSFQAAMGRIRTEVGKVIIGQDEVPWVGVSLT